MEMKNRKLAAEIAEERMSMIAPLLSQNMDSRRVEQLRQEICERNQISQRTLERYLCAYLNGGFEALKPQSRSSQSNYKIPQELLDEAIQLRRELPSRSIPTIIKILELEKKAPPGFLKRTTLQDALSRAGYSTAMMKLYNDKGYASQRFQRLHRHDLWQGDIEKQLTYAGHPNAIFSEDAMKAVHSFSSGIPRLINRACTQSLVYAYQNRRSIIDDRMVQLVLEGEVS